MESLHRHEAMRPLSRHHHHALTIAVKIRKSLKDGTAAPETLRALREEVVSFWEQGGQAHFREEEELLLPAFSRYASIRQEPIIEMVLEHAIIRGLAAAIREGVALAPDQLSARLQELSEVLDRHVRREERVIFPLVEAALPEEELQKLAPYFHEFQPACRLE